MDELQARQLIVVLVYTESKEQPRIASVDNFMISELQEVCHLRISLNYVPVAFYFYPGALSFVVGYVPSAESCLALSVL